MEILFTTPQTRYCSRNLTISCKRGLHSIETPNSPPNYFLSLSSSSCKYCALPGGLLLSRCVISVNFSNNFSILDKLTSFYAAKEFYQQLQRDAEFFLGKRSLRVGKRGVSGTNIRSGFPCSLSTRSMNSFPLSAVCPSKQTLFVLKWKLGHKLALFLSLEFGCFKPTPKLTQ